MTTGGKLWQMLVAFDDTDPAAQGYGLTGSAPGFAVAAGMAMPAKQHHAAGLGLSVASGFKRPLGWRGAGAFRLDGQAAGIAWAQRGQITKNTGYAVSGHLSHLKLRSGPVIAFDDLFICTAEVTAEQALTPSVNMSFSVRSERPVTSAYAYMPQAVAVAPDGHVTFTRTRLTTSDLVKFDRVQLSVRRKTRHAGPLLSFDVTGLRDGFGRTESLATMRYQLRF